MAASSPSEALVMTKEANLMHRNKIIVMILPVPIRVILHPIVAIRSYTTQCAFKNGIFQIRKLGPSHCPLGYFKVSLIVV